MNINATGMADALKSIRLMVANGVPSEHILEMLDSLIRLMNTMSHVKEWHQEPKQDTATPPNNVVPFKPKGVR